MKPIEVGVATAVGIACGLYLTYLVGKVIKNKRKKWIEVGRVKSLYVYPIKSCKYLPLTSAEVTPLGIKSGEYQDRHFVIANDEGKFITAREIPKFVLIEPIIDEGCLKLKMENQPDSITVILNKVVEDGQKFPITLWFDAVVEAFYCGDEIANWICNAVSKPVGSLKLFYFVNNPNNKRGVSSHPGYVKFGGKRTDKVVFPDDAPVNLQTQASLDDLNSRFTDKNFSILNFRPNILVTGNGPYDEDNWGEIRIGDHAKLSYALPCTRCVLTTIDPNTGEKDPRSEPLRTLRTYRQVDKSLKDIFQHSPVFGAQLVVDEPGVIHVGDKVYAVYKSTKIT